jgi:hypothetical protein
MMDTYEDTYKKLSRSNLSEQEQDELLNIAKTDFDRARPGPLIDMLVSDDRSVRALGLQVFGWLGANSFPALNAALALVNDKSDWSRDQILDGVLCYPTNLNCSQASIILSMADDLSVVVRHKVAVFIGCIDHEMLKLAVSKLSSHPSRFEYEEGLALNLLGENSLYFLLETAFGANSMLSTFALGAIERLARSGQIDYLLTYEDKEHHAELLLGNANRLIGRRKQNKIPQAKP